MTFRDIQRRSGEADRQNVHFVHFVHSGAAPARSARRCGIENAARATAGGYCRTMFRLCNPNVPRLVALVLCLCLLAGCGWIIVRGAGSERGVDRLTIGVPI